MLLRQTDYNYQRALVWTAVMTSLVHLDPAFSSVFAIEAVNEPTMNADETPGYGTCEFTFAGIHNWPDLWVVQKNFVDTVRAVELLLGIPVSGMSLGTQITTTNFTQALDDASSLSNVFNENVRAALAAAAPILVDLAIELSVPALLDVNLGGNVDRTTLVTT